MKGGYKIIDFKNVSLSGTPVTMTDVLVDLLNNYEKVVLLSHVVLSGSAKDDCFSTVLSDGAGGVKLNCYDGYISINSSGAVTYTIASASGMTEDIGNLQSGLADTNNMIASQWSVAETYTRNSIVRNDGKLYKAKVDVPTGTVTSNTTYWTTEILASDISALLQNSMMYINEATIFDVLYTKLENYQSASVLITGTIASSIFGVNISCTGTITKAGGNNKLQLFVVSAGTNATLCKAVYDAQTKAWENIYKLAMQEYKPTP